MSNMNTKPLNELKVRVGVRSQTPDRVMANFRVKKTSVMKLTAIAGLMDLSKTKVFEAMIDAVTLMELDQVKRLPLEMELIRSLDGVRSLSEKLNLVVEH